MCRLILTAGLCLIMASLASTSCINGCATGFCDGRTNGNYVNPNNPYTYYACSNGLTYDMPCPSGLIYKASCDCCNYSCESPDPVPEPTYTPSPDPFCKTKVGGVYCYPPDQHKFYHCCNGNTYIKDCPANLVFRSSCSCCTWN